MCGAVFCDFRLKSPFISETALETFPESRCDVDQHQNYIFLLVIHLAAEKKILRICRNLLKVLVTLICYLLISPCYMTLTLLSMSISHTHDPGSHTLDLVITSTDSSLNPAVTRANTQLQITFLFFRT